MNTNYNYPQNAGIQEDKYLSVAELAAYIPYTVNTIYTMVYRRKIPYHKPSGRPMFKKSEIDEWIRGRQNIKVEIPDFING